MTTSLKYDEKIDEWKEQRGSSIEPIRSCKITEFILEDLDVKAGDLVVFYDGAGKHCYLDLNHIAYVEADENGELTLYQKVGRAYFLTADIAATWKIYDTSVHIRIFRPKNIYMSHGDSNKNEPKVKSSISLDKVEEDIVGTFFSGISYGNTHEEEFYLAA